MINDLIQQIRKHKEEGAELVKQNLQLNDQLLNAQKEIEQLKFQISPDMRLATPEKEEEASDEIEFDQIEALEANPVELGMMEPITEEDDHNSDLRQAMPENLIY